MSARWTEEDYAEWQRRRQSPDPHPDTVVAPPVRKLTTKCDYKVDLVQQLHFRGIDVEPEFKIFETRRFKADWRVTDTRVLIEFEGGLFAKGKQGHSSITGILRDIEKYNLCALGGWVVIRVTPKHVTSGEALTWIEMAVQMDYNANAKAIGAV